MVKTAWFTGNPVYPFFYDIWGGPDWSQACWRQFADWQASIGHGAHGRGLHRLPLRVILAAGEGYAHFDGSLNKMWIALLPLSVVAAFWNRTVRACLAVSGIYFVCWASASQQLRFLIPVIPVLAIVAALALGELVDRLFARKVVVVGCVCGPLLSGGWAPDPRGEWEFAKAAEVVGRYGGKDREAVMKSAVPGEFAFMNRELPMNARLLFLNTNFGFFSEREYIADSFFETSANR